MFDGELGVCEGTEPAPGPHAPAVVRQPPGVGCDGPPPGLACGLPLVTVTQYKDAQVQPAFLALPLCFVAAFAG